MYIYIVFHILGLELKTKQALKSSTLTTALLTLFTKYMYIHSFNVKDFFFFIVKGNEKVLSALFRNRKSILADVYCSYLRNTSVSLD